MTLIFLDASGGAMAIAVENALAYREIASKDSLAQEKLYLERRFEVRRT